VPQRKASAYNSNDVTSDHDLAVQLQLALDEESGETSFQEVRPIQQVQAKMSPMMKTLQGD
ncbi:3507_t:CDS:2, partial [Acaulospora morrowiae]